MKAKKPKRAERMWADRAEDSDEMLVKRASFGDKIAFRKLVSKYYDRIYFFLFKLVSSKEMALDLVQEVFAKIYLNLKNFRQDSSFITWAYKVAYNTAIDYLRKKGKVVEVSTDNEVLDNDVGNVSLLTGSIPSPESTLFRKEVCEKIQDAIDSLKPEHRAVVVMALLDGLSTKEIAEALNIPMGTVVSRLHYAKKILQKRLIELLDRGS